MKEKETENKKPEKGKVNFELLESYSPKDFILIKEPPKYLTCLPEEKVLFINLNARRSGVYKCVKKTPRKKYINYARPRIKLVSTALARYNPKIGDLYLLHKEIDKARRRESADYEAGNIKVRGRFDLSVLWKCLAALVAVLAFLFTSVLVNRMFDSFYDEGISIAKQTVPAVVEIRVDGHTASGVIIRESGGKTYIVTNCHVTGENPAPGTIFVKPYGKNAQEVVATFCDAQRDLDLALIYINSTGLTVARQAKKAPEYGQTIYAVGNPLDGGIAISKGIISQPVVEIRGLLSTEPGYAEQYFANHDAIKFSAPIDHGNSGGGLFNSRGELLGIIYGFVVLDDIISTNFAYAVPLSLLNEFLSGYFR